MKKDMYKEYSELSILMTKLLEDYYTEKKKNYELIKILKMILNRMDKCLFCDCADGKHKDDCFYFKIVDIIKGNDK